MASKTKDVFGFDELQKGFNRLIERYPDEADALLMAQGQATNKKVKSLTPVYEGYPKEGVTPGQLRRSWRLKKVKQYKSGKVRVVRIQSTAPHAHLVEQGHKLVLSHRRRDSRGRYAKEDKRLGKIGSYSKEQLAAKGITGITRGKFVEGTHMLEYGITESGKRFKLDVQKMLEKLTKDVQA